MQVKGLGMRSSLGIPLMASVLLGCASSPHGSMDEATSAENSEVKKKGEAMTDACKQPDGRLRLGCFPKDTVRPGPSKADEEKPESSRFLVPKPDAPPED